MPEFQPGMTFTCEGKVLHKNGDGSFDVQFGPSVQVRLYEDQMGGLTPENFEGGDKPRMGLEDPRRAARKAQQPGPEAETDDAPDAGSAPQGQQVAAAEAGANRPR